MIKKYVQQGNLPRDKNRAICYLLVVFVLWCLFVLTPFFCPSTNTFSPPSKTQFLGTLSMDSQKKEVHSVLTVKVATEPQSGNSQLPRPASR